MAEVTEKVTILKRKFLVLTLTKEINLMYYLFDKSDAEF